MGHARDHARNKVNRKQPQNGPPRAPFAAQVDPLAVMGHNQRQTRPKSPKRNGKKDSSQYSKRLCLQWCLAVVPDRPSNSQRRFVDAPPGDVNPRPRQSRSAGGVPRYARFSCNSRFARAGYWAKLA
jgi:hypothetical protein